MTTHQTRMGAPVPTKRRAVTVVLWTIQLLLVATFVFVAMQKLFGYPSSVRTFSKIGLGQWFRYVTGSVELTGAIGLLIPRLSGLAALGLVGVMISATITNLLVLYPAMVALNALLGVAAALIARVRWAETKALVEYVRR